MKIIIPLWWCHEKKKRTQAVKACFHVWFDYGLFPLVLAWKRAQLDNRLGSKKHGDGRVESERGKKKKGGGLLIA